MTDIEIVLVSELFHFLDRARGSMILEDRTDDRVSFQGLRRDRGVIGRSIGATIFFRDKGREHLELAASLAIELDPLL